MRQNVTKKTRAELIQDVQIWKDACISHSQEIDKLRLDLSVALDGKDDAEQKQQRIDRAVLCIDMMLRIEHNFERVAYNNAQSQETTPQIRCLLALRDILRR